MKSLRTVVQEVAAQLVVTRDYSLPLCMRLRYEPSDPYVVRATFFTHSDDPGEWVLGRDLLADGLSGSAGDGDIRIWSATGHGGHGMYITLGSRAPPCSRFPCRTSKPSWRTPRLWCHGAPSPDTSTGTSNWRTCVQKAERSLPTSLPNRSVARPCVRCLRTQPSLRRAPTTDNHAQ